MAEAGDMYRKSVVSTVVSGVDNACKLETQGIASLNQCSQSLQALAIIDPT